MVPKKPVALYHFPQFMGMNWGLTRCISDMLRYHVVGYTSYISRCILMICFRYPITIPRSCGWFYTQIRMFVLLTTHVHC